LKLTADGHVVRRRARVAGRFVATARERQPKYRHSTAPNIVSHFGVKPPVNLWSDSSE
jgi:hypothetical protein